jgi:hypothetical protein
MWYSYFMIKSKRVVVYVPQDICIRLKTHLASLDKTVSCWFREQAQSFSEKMDKANTDPFQIGSKEPPEKISKKNYENIIDEAANQAGKYNMDRIMGFKLCKANFCNNSAEEGSEFCKEHK